METADFPIPYIGPVREIRFFVIRNIIRFHITDMDGSEIHVLVRSTESIPPQARGRAGNFSVLAYLPPVKGVQFFHFTALEALAF